jgi:hypothetical protein
MPEQLRIGPYRALDTIVEVTRGLQNDLGAVVESYDVIGGNARVDLRVDIGPTFLMRRRQELTNRVRRNVETRLAMCERVRTRVSGQRMRTESVRVWLRQTAEAHRTLPGSERWAAVAEVA